MEYFTDKNEKHIFASQDLRDTFLEEIAGQNEKDPIFLNLAYTDYGGTFFDIVLIRFFEEKFPENIVVEITGYFGKNAIVFGDFMAEFREITENYPLGYDELEDFYYEVENEFTVESFEFFINDLDCDYGLDTDEKKGKVLDWLTEHKAGYFSLTTQGLDFCFETLENELVSENVILKQVANDDDFEQLPTFDNPNQQNLDLPY